MIRSSLAPVKRDSSDPGRHYNSREIVQYLGRASATTTARIPSHHVGDVNREYRTREEEKEWMTKHDPLQTLAGRLTGQGLADASVFERIQTDVVDQDVFA